MYLGVTNGVREITRRILDIYSEILNKRAKANVRSFKDQQCDVQRMFVLFYKMYLNPAWKIQFTNEYFFIIDYHWNRLTKLLNQEAFFSPEQCPFGERGITLFYYVSGNILHTVVSLYVFSSM